jgi:hypothetical protein
MAHLGGNSWAISGFSDSAKLKCEQLVRLRRRTNHKRRFGSSRMATPRGWLSRVSSRQAEAFCEVVDTSADVFRIQPRLVASISRPRPLVAQHVRCYAGSVARAHHQDRTWRLYGRLTPNELSAKSSWFFSTNDLFHVAIRQSARQGDCAVLCA